MAISFIGEAHGSTNYGSSITVSVPASTANNDVMIAIVGGTRSSSPSGWTLIDSVSTGTASLGTVYCYYRVASSEPGSYTFNLSGSFLGSAAILTYRGVSTSTPVDATEDVSSVGASTNFNTATLTAPSNTWALYFAQGYEYGNSSTRTFSESAGTERLDFSVSNSGSPDNTNLSVTDSNGTISAGSFSRGQTRSATPSGGARGLIFLRVNAVSGSANTATSGVDVDVFSADGVGGSTPAAPKASVSAAAFNPASIFSGHFAFPGTATVSIPVANAVFMGRGVTTATAYNAVPYFGTPVIRDFIVENESRTKLVPHDTRTVVVEDG